MDYKTLGQNIRRLRVTQGFRQEDLAEKCGCSSSHIGQSENGRVMPSLEMTVRIANALNATTDQLLAHEFSHPEEIYLKEIAERIEKYPVSKRILACEGFNTYLDSLESDVLIAVIIIVTTNHYFIHSMPSWHVAYIAENRAVKRYGFSLLWWHAPRRHENGPQTGISRTG